MRVRGVGSDSSDGRRQWLVAILTTVAALFITLGEASDAFFLTRDLSRELYSKLTHSLEYETVGRLHSGITSEYASTLLGAAKVSRNVGNGIVARYFESPKFIVTLFESEGRVAGWTLVPRIEGFEPPVELSGGRELRLGQFTFADASGQDPMTAVDHSRLTSFYLERLETGASDRFVDVFLGSVPYGPGGSADAIADLYEAEVMGTPREVEAAVREMRRASPNLYGEGSLELEQVRGSILTNAEFEDYFGPT